MIDALSKQLCHKNFNDCRLDSFYRLVAGLDLINFGFFLIYAIEHKPNPGLKAEKTNGENDSAVSSTLKEENRVYLWGNCCSLILLSVLI